MFTPTPITPDVAILDLPDDERAIVCNLSERLLRRRADLEIFDSYYNSEQWIPQLGISIPEELEALRTVCGWPRLAVDVLDERLEISGFRLPNSLDASSDIWEIWTENQMDAEFHLAQIDSFVFGRGFGMAGSRADSDVPLLTVESPMSMVADLNPITRAVSSALQIYEMEGTECAALYMPTRTVHMRMTPVDKVWEVFEIDEHNLGDVPVVMLSNRARTHDRYGFSEITPEIMSVTDAACRTLLGMEIAREFFGAPQRYALGVRQEDFQDKDGNPSSPWETYIGRIMALGNDPESDKQPSVGTFTSGNPQAFTEIIQLYARVFSAITGVPQNMVGFAADNPASADAIRSAEARLDKRARRKQPAMNPQVRRLMQLAMRIADPNNVPDDINKLEVMWAPVETPTPTATTESMLQQIQMGYMPATAEIVGERLGYSAVERARIALAREQDAGMSVLAELAVSLQAKEARTDASVANDIKAPTTPEPTNRDLTQAADAGVAK